MQSMPFSSPSSTIEHPSVVSSKSCPQVEQPVDELNEKILLMEKKINSSPLQSTSSLHMKSVNTQQKYPQDKKPRYAPYVKTERIAKECCSAELVPCISSTRMQKNLAKSLENYASHADTDEDDSGAVDTDTELLTTEKLIGASHSIRVLSCSSFSSQGRRTSMEDTYLVSDLASKTLVAVFDGHGGDFVATFAADMFAPIFYQALEQNPYDIPAVFETTFTSLQKRIAEKKLISGTTAVVTYINKAVGCAYTATLGDSTAKLYRQQTCIPLSCVRNWTSTKDKKRAFALQPSLADKWQSIPQAKLRYVNAPQRRDKLNISRSLGDLMWGEIISQKCKVTACSLLEGDVLVLTSDGVSDYCEDHELLNAVVQPYADKANLAERIVGHAYEKESKDNITAIAVRIGSIKS